MGKLSLNGGVCLTNIVELFFDPRLPCERAEALAMHKTLPLSEKLVMTYWLGLDVSKISRTLLRGMQTSLAFGKQVLSFGTQTMSFETQIKFFGTRIISFEIQIIF